MCAAAADSVLPAATAHMLQALSGTWEVVGRGSRVSQAGIPGGTAIVQHVRECRAGDSPTCWGLHRRDASQYRHSQFRMVHSRGAVCVHTSCQKPACGAYLSLATCPLAQKQSLPTRYHTQPMKGLPDPHQPEIFSTLGKGLQVRMNSPLKGCAARISATFFRHSSEGQIL